MRYLLLGWMLWLPAGSAQAQLRLPGLPLVQRPLASLQQPLAGVGSDLAGTVGEARRRAVRALLHDYPQRIEADPQGNVAVRHELLAYRSPEALPAAVMQAGFSLLREVRSEALELHLSVLAPPPGMPTAKALAMLKRLDPGGLYDYNHLYLGGGQLQAETPLELPEHAPEAPTVRGVRVGLIDTGIERSHPAFGAARIRAWGCGGSTRGGAHGTAIASLMVGRAPPSTACFRRPNCTRPTSIAASRPAARSTRCSAPLAGSRMNACR